jgi:hypothetical protein
VIETSRAGHATNFSFSLRIYLSTVRYTCVSVVSKQSNCREIGHHFAMHGRINNYRSPNNFEIVNYVAILKSNRLAFDISGRHESGD